MFKLTHRDTDTTVLHMASTFIGEFVIRHRGNMGCNHCEVWSSKGIRYVPAIETGVWLGFGGVWIVVERNFYRICTTFTEVRVGRSAAYDLELGEFITQYWSWRDELEAIRMAWPDIR